MRDRGAIWSGVAIFLALATFPVWHNLASHVTAKGPDVRPPAREKQCVAPVEYMRTSHMKLLIDWREKVVREGGDPSRMSLTPTCLEKCHGSKSEFCDRCHNYAAVAPSCWNCHQDFKPVGQPILAAAAHPVGFETAAPGPRQLERLPHNAVGPSSAQPLGQPILAAAALPGGFATAAPGPRRLRGGGSPDRLPRKRSAQ
jgi:hypothetical protein